MSRVLIPIISRNWYRATAKLMFSSSFRGKKATISSTLNWLFGVCTLLRYFSVHVSRQRGSSATVFLFPSSVTRLTPTGFELQSKYVKLHTEPVAYVCTHTCTLKVQGEAARINLFSSSSSSITDALVKVRSSKPTPCSMSSCVWFSPPDD